MADVAARLVLLRHGTSLWNASDRSTGWVDIDLAPAGEAEARAAAGLLGDADLLPDVVHSSVLVRAVRTAELALAAAGRTRIPIHTTWRLNERHYGALQGRDKQETARRHGAEQLHRWRRSYDEAPPPMADDDPWSQSADPAYASLPGGPPRTESLRDVSARLLPYWEGAILPDLRRGRTVLVVAHGNSLRALVKHLDGISDESIVGLEIPNGAPLAYALDAELRPVAPGGVYLGPE